MSMVPIISSAADLESAIKFAANRPSSRWYVAKRAEALGQADMIPASWGMTAAGPSEAVREKAAKKGQALPDGSYPIRNKADLHKAIQAYGRAKNKAAAKRHIIKRARALGATKELPEDWGVTASAESEEALVAVGWNPSLHPRDRDGRFIEIGDFVNLFDTSGGSTPIAQGKVVGNLSKGGKDFIQVEVHYNDPRGGKNVLTVDPAFTESAPAAKARLDAPDTKTLIDRPTGNPANPIKVEEAPQQPDTPFEETFQNLANADTGNPISDPTGEKRDQRRREMGYDNPFIKAGWQEGDNLTNNPQTRAKKSEKNNSFPADQSEVGVTTKNADGSVGWGPTYGRLREAKASSNDVSEAMTKLSDADLDAIARSGQDLNATHKLAALVELDRRKGGDPNLPFDEAGRQEADQTQIDDPNELFWAVQNALVDRGYDDAQEQKYDEAINEAIDTMESRDPGDIADQVVRYIEEGAFDVSDGDQSQADYDAMLDESGPIEILGEEFQPSDVLKQIDPVGYRSNSGFDDGDVAKDVTEPANDKVDEMLDDLDGQVEINGVSYSRGMILREMAPDVYHSLVNEEAENAARDIIDDDILHVDADSFEQVRDKIDEYFGSGGHFDDSVVKEDLLGRLRENIAQPIYDAIDTRLEANGESLDRETPSAAESYVYSDNLDDGRSFDEHVDEILDTMRNEGLIKGGSIQAIDAPEDPDIEKKWSMEQSAITTTLGKELKAQGYDAEWEALQEALRTRDKDAADEAIVQLQLEGVDRPALKDAFDRIQALPRYRLSSRPEKNPPSENPTEPVSAFDRQEIRNLGDRLHSLMDTFQEQDISHFLDDHQIEVNDAARELEDATITGNHPNEISDALQKVDDILTDWSNNFEPDNAKDPASAEDSLLEVDQLLGEVRDWQQNLRDRAPQPQFESRLERHDRLAREYPAGQSVNRVLDGIVQPGDWEVARITDRGNVRLKDRESNTYVDALPNQVQIKQEPLTDNNSNQPNLAVDKNGETVGVGDTVRLPLGHTGQVTSIDEQNDSVSVKSFDTSLEEEFSGNQLERLAATPEEIQQTTPEAGGTSAPLSEIRNLAATRGTPNFGYAVQHAQQLADSGDIQGAIDVLRKEKTNLSERDRQYVTPDTEQISDSQDAAIERAITALLQSNDLSDSGSPADGGLTGTDLPRFPHPDDKVAWHKANGPETWKVEKQGNEWAIKNAAGTPLERYRSKKEAESELTSGSALAVKRWNQESEWYDGGQGDPQWRPWPAVRAENLKSWDKYGKGERVSAPARDANSGTPNPAKTVEKPGSTDNTAFSGFSMAQLRGKLASKSLSDAEKEAIREEIRQRVHGGKIEKAKASGKLTKTKVAPIRTDSISRLLRSDAKDATEIRDAEGNLLGTVQRGKDVTEIMSRDGGINHVSGYGTVRSGWLAFDPKGNIIRQPGGYYTHYTQQDAIASLRSPGKA